MATKAKERADKASDDVVKLKDDEMQALNENSVNEDEVVTMIEGRLSQTTLKTVEDSTTLLLGASRT